MKKKKYYEKIYITTISICSECHSRENETYIPKKLVDLTNSDNNENKDTKEINDLKYIPLPICLFNMTDNNVITLLTCHKLITEHKKNDCIRFIFF